jgi:hypothetical protein
MEKRSFERIDADIDVRFSYGYMFYTGAISNLSEKGLFVRTKNCLPDNSIVLIMLRLENELVKLLARVTRSIRSGNNRDGMGIEILNPQKKIPELCREPEIHLQHSNKTDATEAF